MKMITSVRAYFEGHPRLQGLYLCVMSSLLVYATVIDPAQSGEPTEIWLPLPMFGIMVGLLGILYVTLGSAFHEWMFKDGKLTRKGRLASSIFGFLYGLWLGFEILTTILTTMVLS